MLTMSYLYIRERIRNLLLDEDGAVATEYVFLIAFLALAVAFGAVLYGQAILDFFGDVSGAVEGSAADASTLETPTTPTSGE